MVNGKTAAERAQRERERYNEGLQRGTYDRLLNPAKTWFMEARRKQVAEVFGRYDDPRVLEIGSNTWVNWIERNNITLDRLTCINISERELDTGRKRAADSRTKPEFILMDAQRLAFPDNHFDIVFGSAILHHIDMRLALPEIARVLKPGGSLVFAEPMDMNPIGRIVRLLTPKARTADERPFRLHDLRLILEHFDCKFRFEGFISVPVGVVSAMLRLPPRNPVTRAAFALDTGLARIPGFGYMCRHVMIEGRARQG
jgi:SAM-dependent methyltransferase